MGRGFSIARKKNILTYKVIVVCFSEKKVVVAIFQSIKDNRTDHR